jgi:hypothetical protein
VLFSSQSGGAASLAKYDLLFGGQKNHGVNSAHYLSFPRKFQGLKERRINGCYSSNLQTFNPSILLKEE